VDESSPRRKPTVRLGEIEKRLLPFKNEITSLSIVFLISYSIQNIKCAQKSASRKYATGESRLRSGPLVSTSCAYYRQARGGSYVERILVKNLRISLSARYLLPATIV
jgi:hypothetical protein